VLVFDGDGSPALIDIDDGNARVVRPGDRHWTIFSRFPDLRWRHPLD
jgi:hypothetical protein